MTAYIRRTAIPITCAQLEELTDGVGLEAVPDHRRVDVVEHVKGCDSCQARVARLDAGSEELANDVTPLEPPADFAKRTLERLADERQADRRP